MSFSHPPSLITRKQSIPISVSWFAYSFSPSIFHFPLPIPCRKYSIHDGQKQVVAIQLSCHIDSS